MADIAPKPSVIDQTSLLSVMASLDRWFASVSTSDKHSGVEPGPPPGGRDSIASAGQSHRHGQSGGGEADAVVAGLMADHQAQLTRSRLGVGCEPDAGGQLHGTLVQG